MPQSLFLIKLQISTQFYEIVKKNTYDGYFLNNELFVKIVYGLYLYFFWLYFLLKWLKVSISSMNFRVEKTLNLKSKRSRTFYGSWKYLTTNLIHFIYWSLYIPSIPFFCVFPGNIYLFKVNNRNARCKICLKLTIKTPERRHWRISGVFIVNFEHISHLFLLLLLLNLNK